MVVSEEYREQHRICCEILAYISGEPMIRIDIDGAIAYLTSKRKERLFIHLTSECVKDHLCVAGRDTRLLGTIRALKQAILKESDPILGELQWSSLLYGRLNQKW